MCNDCIKRRISASGGSNDGGNSSTPVFDMVVSCKGRSKTLCVTTATTPSAVHAMALRHLGLDSATSSVKLVLKGKRLDPTDAATPLFTKQPKKTPRLMALVTPLQVANEIADKQSDPTIRGFDKEAERTQQQHKANARSSKQHWGSNTAQDRQYRFVQIEACTWHSFGHRPTESTPHAFEAFALLEKLSTDPGMVAIMRERELVVNTLGEMDPVDDRLMQKKQQQGGCLLGYNTNHGLRIDIKLRTDDLASLRPYHELAATLIHELSHNWVGEHNLLFWTNYAQMRAEYLYMHRNLQTSLLYRVQGKTTAQIAGWSKEALQNIPESILNELTREMAQHGLHPRMIENAIRVRCAELERENKMPPISGGQRLGGGGAAAADNVNANAAVSTNQAMSARERALAAAERRAREQRERSNK